MSRRKRPAAKPKRAARASGETAAVAPGIVWPAVQGFQDTYALALQFQLDASQWWSPKRLLAHQLHQVQNLIDHAARHVPFYRERLRPFAGLARGALSLGRFRRIPLLTRDDIQAAGRALESRWLPPEHGRPAPSMTSGSTSRPIKFQTTVMTSLMVKT